MPSPSDLSRRSFVLQGGGAAVAATAACRVEGPTSLPPDQARFLAELSAGVDRLTALRIFGEDAELDPVVAEEMDRRLQATMHTLMVSGTSLDLEPEQRAHPEVQAAWRRVVPNANYAAVNALWEAEDMLANTHDPLLAAMDADPDLPLQAAAILDRAASKAGLPRRWRRRLRKTASNMAWRIKRQSARAVVDEAVTTAHKMLEPVWRPEAEEEVIAFLTASGAAPAPGTESQPAIVPDPEAGSVPATSAPAVQSPSSGPAPVPLAADVAPVTDTTSAAETTTPAADAAADAATPSSPAGGPAASTAAPAMGATAAAPVPDASAPAVTSEPTDSPGRGSRRRTSDLLGHLVVVSDSHGPIAVGTLIRVKPEKLILLANRNKRIRVPLGMAHKVQSRGPNPMLVKEARTNAVGILVAGVVLTAAPAFTWFIPVLNFITLTAGFTAGVVLLIIGIIRMVQTKEAHQRMKAAGRG